jgi:hypothetical protein
MTALLDLVRQRIDAQLEKARSSTMLSHFGVWLGVFDRGQAWKPPDGLRQYIAVAEAAMVSVSQENDEATQYFTAGVAWLQKRRFFVPGQAMSLEADPLACVALAIGIRTRGLNDAVRWMIDMAQKASDQEQDIFRKELFSLARALAANDEASWSMVAPVLSVACSGKLGKHASREEYHRAFEKIMSLEEIEPEKAIFYKAALGSIFAIEATVNLAQPTIDQVGKLLRGIPAALKRWPWEDKRKTQHRDITAQQWDIQHEYHVQSLVWAVLRPVFPGLEDEENLPSLGPKHPRADILIPGLRLVIEIKYLREATQGARAKIIEEIAADSSIYRTVNSGYEAVIAFVWDNTASTNHHAEIEAGIRRLPGIADAVIVSRPGEWR